MGTMMDNETSKKIKSQKSAAILLILGSLFVLLFHLKSNDFVIKHNSSYALICALIVLMVCGFMGLRNSLRKEKGIYRK